MKNNDATDQNKEIRKALKLHIYHKPGISKYIFKLLNRLTKTTAVVSGTLSAPVIEFLSELSLKIYNKCKCICSTTMRKVKIVLIPVD